MGLITWSISLGEEETSTNLRMNTEWILTYKQAELMLEAGRLPA